MIGNLTTPEIEDLLINNVIARIGCHANGVTYVVPTSYAYDGEFVYCHSQEGMKVDMMRQNPAVCFEVDSLDTMANWKSLIAWGKFEEITDPVQRTNAIQKLNERTLPQSVGQKVKLSELWPFSSEEAEVNGVVYKIRLTKKTGRYEEEGESPDTGMAG